MTSRSSCHQEDLTTIKMMKLYQENVKQVCVCQNDIIFQFQIYYIIIKDITTTSSVIKLVEKKLQDCHSSLASLKQVATELNKDYQSMETKVSNLGSSFKEISLSSSPSPLITAAVASVSSSSLSSGVSRSSSLSSIVDGGSEESRQSSEQDSSSSEELEDLVDSYVIIKRNPDGTATIQPTTTTTTTTSLNQKKARYSIGSGSSSSSTELSSSDSDAEIPNDSGERYNNYLIKMLLERS